MDGFKNESTMIKLQGERFRAIAFGIACVREGAQTPAPATGRSSNVSRDLQGASKNPGSATT